MAQLNVRISDDLFFKLKRESSQPDMNLQKLVSKILGEAMK